MAVSRINEAGLNVNQYGNRNLIINGGMQVAQRGTSFNQPADGAYTLDRFAAFRNGAGIVDVDQSTTVPTGQGFKNSFKCTVDTADSSLGSTDFGGFLTKIEGQDLKRFEFGNSSAKKFALSFWVRSNITGTYSVSLRNGAANRYLVKEYTISSVDTWQHITITDTADVTGTWTTDATTGLDLRWCLWEGGFSAAANTWGAGNIIGSSSNVNWAATAGNTFYITGVQLEVGDTATDFEHRTFADELQRCRRYAYLVGKENGKMFTSACFARSGYLDLVYGPLPLLQELRVSPTLTYGGNIRGTNFSRGYNTKTTTGLVTYDFGSTKLGGIRVTFASDWTAGDEVFIGDDDGTGFILLDAEL